MNAKRLPPDDPKEWLNRAYSNLSQAKGGINLSNVYLEDLCFQAQQAVEKALKAVLIAIGLKQQLMKHWLMVTYKTIIIRNLR
jgi:HEPN domain-containing protein